MLGPSLQPLRIQHGTARVSATARASHHDAELYMPMLQVVRADRVPHQWIRPLQGPEAAAPPDMPSMAVAPAQGMPAHALSSAMSLQGLSQLPMPGDSRR